jgi:uncharacterized protein (TIRG00374 family)
LKRLEQASFVVGLLLLGWFIYRIGPERVGLNLAELGWGFVLIFGLQAIPIVLNTLSWRLMLAPGSSVPLTAMARMLIAGEAVNAVSPVALVGGELVRISLLSKRIPAQEAVPSVALAAMAQCCAQILFVLSGLPIAITFVQSAPIRVGLVALSAALAVLLGGLLFLVRSAAAHGWIERTIGRSSWLRAISLRVPPTWRDAIPRSLRVLRERPGHFGLSVGASLLVWQMGVVETFLILRFLRAPSGPVQAYGIEVLAVAIEGVLFFVPAKMGTQEGGKILIFLAAGLDPAKGLALGLVRRIRELAWAAVGLGVLGAIQRRKSPISPPDGLPAQSA